MLSRRLYQNIIFIITDVYINLDRFLKLFLFIFIVLYYSLYPYQLINAEKDISLFNILVPNFVYDEPKEQKMFFNNQFPIAEEIKVKYSTYIIATAYTSSPEETDDTPCITANNFNVCEHNTENIIASNFLPLGARVRFPDLYGNKIFYNMDRMNKRYYKRVDFWMKSKVKARQFGVKYIKMEVLY